MYMFLFYKKRTVVAKTKQLSACVQELSVGRAIFNFQSKHKGGSAGTAILINHPSNVFIETRRDWNVRIIAVKLIVFGQSVRACLRPGVAFKQLERKQRFPQKLSTSSMTELPIDTSLQLNA